MRVARKKLSCVLEVVTEPGAVATGSITHLTLRLSSDFMKRWLRVGSGRHRSAFCNYQPVVLNPMFYVRFVFRSSSLTHPLVRVRSKRLEYVRISQDISPAIPEPSRRIHERSNPGTNAGDYRHRTQTTIRQWRRHSDRRRARVIRGGDRADSRHGSHSPRGSCQPHGGDRS